MAALSVMVRCAVEFPQLARKELMRAALDIHHQMRELTSDGILKHPEYIILRLGHSFVVAHDARRYSAEVYVGDVQIRRSEIIVLALELLNRAVRNNHRR